MAALVAAMTGADLAHFIAFAGAVYFAADRFATWLDYRRGGRWQ